MLVHLNKTICICSQPSAHPLSISLIESSPFQHLSQNFLQFLDSYFPQVFKFLSGLLQWAIILIGDQITGCLQGKKSGEGTINSTSSSRMLWRPDFKGGFDFLIFQLIAQLCWKMRACTIEKLERYRWFCLTSCDHDPPFQSVDFSTKHQSVWKKWEHLKNLFIKPVAVLGLGNCHCQDKNPSTLTFRLVDIDDLDDLFPLYWDLCIDHL